MIRKTITAMFALQLCSAVAAAQGLPILAGVAPIDGTIDTRWNEGEAKARTAQTTWSTTGDDHDHGSPGVPPEHRIDSGNGGATTAWDGGQPRTGQHYDNQGNDRSRGQTNATSGRARASSPRFTDQPTDAETEIRAALRDIEYASRSRASSVARATSWRGTRGTRFYPNCHTCRIDAGGLSRGNAAGGRRTQTDTGKHGTVSDTDGIRGPSGYGYGSRPAQQGHNCAGCQRNERSARRTSRYGW